ncbi:MAG: tRNA lysidine(34) synthetase TilS [Ardenticatenaceae bacterium]|nr:tRNA lysidine(34) synthetase TilS [Ardenticatenaceae bacterium]
MYHDLPPADPSPAGCETLPKQVAALLAQWTAAPAAPLVVGVSGGPDSLALLHALWQGGYPAGLLIAAHLNHAIRPAAAADAQFVAETCAAWGIPCHVGQVDVPALQQARGLSLEEAARLARYQFLAQVARQVGAAGVAVGHNADDQAETVLMHFLRGAGLAGLRGMQPQSPLPGAPEIPLLRPLLYTGRDTIEAYCLAHGLTPVQDSSNQDVTLFRNRLRHELLPLLGEYSPQLRQRLGHTARLLAADYELLTALRDEAWSQVLLAETADWLQVDLAGWRALPLSLRRSTLRQAVWRLRSSLRDVGFEPVEQARRVAEDGPAGTQASLPGGLVLTVGYTEWVLAQPGRSFTPAGPQIAQPRPLPVPGRAALVNGWQITAEWLPQVDWAAVRGNRDPFVAYLSPEQVAGLHVRGRRPGERFQPLGLAGHSAKVKEVMINRRIPAGLRARWPVVAHEGHIVWLVGCMIDERAKLPRPGPAVWLRCQLAGGRSASAKP